MHNCGAPFVRYCRLATSHSSAFCNKSPCLPTESSNVRNADCLKSLLNPVISATAWKALQATKRKNESLLPPRFQVRPPTPILERTALQTRPLLPSGRLAPRTGPARTALVYKGSERQQSSSSRNARGARPRTTVDARCGFVAHQVRSLGCYSGSFRSCGTLVVEECRT